MSAAAVIATGAILLAGIGSIIVCLAAAMIDDATRGAPGEAEDHTEDA